MSNAWVANGSSYLQYNSLGSISGDLLEITIPYVRWLPDGGDEWFIAQNGGLVADREIALLRFLDSIEIDIKGEQNSYPLLATEELKGELKLTVNYVAETVDVTVAGSSLIGGVQPANIGTGGTATEPFVVGATSSGIMPVGVGTLVSGVVVSVDGSKLLDSTMQPPGYTGTVVPNNAGPDGTLQGGTLDGTDWLSLDPKNVWLPNGSTGLQFPNPGNLLDTGGGVAADLSITFKNLIWGPVAGGSFLLNLGGPLDTDRELSIIRFNGELEIWAGGLVTIIGGLPNNDVVRRADVTFLPDLENGTIDLLIDGQSADGFPKPINVGTGRVNLTNMYFGCNEGPTTFFEDTNEIGRIIFQKDGETLIDTYMNPAGYTGTVVPNVAGTDSIGDGTLVGTPSGDGTDWGVSSVGAESQHLGPSIGVGVGVGLMGTIFGNDSPQLDAAWYDNEPWNDGDPWIDGV